ncbi:Excision repair cross-complementation group 1 [Rhizopus stolonifer]|uniref:DNA excision repair protein ERCC-1 n=1 Tax=Rhizopus stolonifer TaxID=4846 RepID=A0A367IQF0_RHIST|nr:Excision repair cross-complementation group 1 [Rhizopus stolonifer]
MPNESTLKIPSLEEIEKQKVTSSKPKTLFFRANPSTDDTAQNKPIQPNTSHVQNKPPSTNGYKRTVGNTILVNPTQQKNPVLKFIRNVPYEPSESIKMDYVVGQTTGVIYLSLRYHRLYPTYIYDRLNSVKGLFVTRILLVYVDAENYHDAVREINRVAILSDFTLMLCWSLEEAGRYLESFKALENSGADLIREKVENDYLTKMTDCLTNIRSVNKTDVLTLLSNFGSLKNVIETPAEELSLCPGFGEQKVRRIQNVWKQPFLINKKKAL